MAPRASPPARGTVPSGARLVQVYDELTWGAGKLLSIVSADPRLTLRFCRIIVHVVNAPEMEFEFTLVVHY